ncbi:MAG: hypothetical protein Q6J18_01505 [Gloeomargarita sp. DG02_3_bins_56]
MSTVAIVTHERNNQCILTEYTNHIGSVGRLSAIFGFAIFAGASFFILSDILSASGLFYIGPSFFGPVNPEEAAGSIAFFGSILLIFLL